MSYNIKRCKKKTKENWMGEQRSEIGKNLRTPIHERLDHYETRKTYSYPRLFRKMPHRKTRDTESMDRILL